MKRTKLLRVAVLAMLTCMLFASHTFAGNRGGAFNLSPMVGGHVFEGDQVINDDLTYGLSLGYNFTDNWGAELAYNFTSTDATVGPAKFDVDTHTYHLDLLYHLWPDNPFVPYLAIGAGAITYDPETDLSPRSYDAETDFMVNYGLGVKLFLHDNFALRADARHLMGFDQGLDDGSETDNNMIYSGGLTFQMGGAVAPPPVLDSDGDGVLDPQDKCPDTPRGVKVDSVGCPVDTDGDGVPDYRDSCPDTPKGAQVDGKGCPLDSDGDGVIDFLDKCPDTPKGAPVDKMGCPLDSDGDGVPDYLDQCPDTPKGAPVDKMGCPLDSDGDGVYDYLDKCPNTAKGVQVDERGCPLTFTLNIEFDFDKADIRPAYHKQLAEAAAFIRKYAAPQYLIAGHTDSKGSDEYNMRLSERRAKAVRDYLVANFDLKGSKLVPRGYGETKPVADNATEEGRQKNRRVEVICCVVLPD